MGYHHWPPAQILDMAWADIVFAHAATARYTAREAKAIKDATGNGN